MLKALVLAEYYPRAYDPVLGVWAHRQALATRAAGADVRVLVLHRPVPSRAAIRARDVSRARAVLTHPRRLELDGLEVRYVPYLSPPRSWSYEGWGAWAAPSLWLALRSLRREFPYELVHAHYAVPAGDAVRRSAPGVPLVVSVHGHDVQGAGSGGPNVRATLLQARLVLANSEGTAARCRGLGASVARVIHLGADLLESRAPVDATQAPTLVTVAHLAERKRHRDVISALALLRDRHPGLRYEIVGDGPERERLAALARQLGVDGMVRMHGQLPHEEALAIARSASLFVLPSVREAFGVAYIEAMAAGVPAIGCEGEDGPSEIARAGGGIVLVPAGDTGALAQTIDRLLVDPAAHQRLSLAARDTVAREFTWEQCGRRTIAAYEEALRRGARC